MTIWDMRQWMEQAIPWWVPFAIGTVLLVLAVVIHRPEKR